MKRAADIIKSLTESSAKKEQGDNFYSTLNFAKQNANRGDKKKANAYYRELGPIRLHRKLHELWADATKVDQQYLADISLAYLLFQHDIKAQWKRAGGWL